jgi:hypothetical protein
MLFCDKRTKQENTKARKHESTKLKHILFLPLVFQRGFPKESPKELSKRKSKEEKERGVGKTAYTKRVLPKQPIT